MPPEFGFEAPAAADGLIHQQQYFLHLFMAGIGGFRAMTTFGSWRQAATKP
ncbi:MAG: hypothetical protein ACYDIC_11710 [Desulfobaccales bacterium]